MAVICPSRRSVGALLFAILCSSLTTGEARSSYDPAHPTQASKPRQGFVDFTLARINSRNLDYGKCLDEDRRVLLDETIEKGYFWSNLVSLSLLGCLFLIVVYQHKNHAKQDWTTSTLLAEHEHALARSTAEMNEVTAKNRGLMDALNAHRQATLRLSTLPTGASDAATTSKGQRSTTVPTTHSVGNGAEHAAAVATATKPASQIALFHDGDLTVTINSLRQQLAHSEEEKKLLRRRIANADRQLAAEQHKNRQLKGG